MCELPTLEPKIYSGDFTEPSCVSVIHLMVPIRLRSTFFIAAINFFDLIARTVTTLACVSWNVINRHQEFTPD